MKRIGVILKKRGPGPGVILDSLVPWLRERGVTVYAEEGSVPGLDVVECALQEMPELVEMVIVLGGDGTMLGAARLVSEKGIPILGINLGGLGFITEVHKEEIYEALESILNDECPTEERMMLTAELVRRGKSQGKHSALNDIVVNKGALATMLDLECRVNDVYVTHFKTDGLIVSTPTGSTAYSLSSGGPILYPTLNNIVLTPICPHTLTNRPIVLPDDVEVSIMLQSASESVLLTYDGQVAEQVLEGDEVIVKKSPHVTKLLMPCGRDHFQVLRTKLKWGER
jgi:NAD+ kinase